MTIAARTREAVRACPALWTALAADAVNYTAAARLIAADVDADDDDHEAVVAALRRYADELRVERVSTDASVRMVSGVGLVDRSETETSLLTVGERAVVDGAGTHTALVIEGEDLDGRALGTVLARLDAEGIAADAAGLADERAVVAVDRRDGADAVRAVEDALDAVPAVETA
ncbi:hypothetical protein BRD18_01415 [Halobacteriales archaeon SW_7_71_33]|nr:MAG: hypothetical protein BRD18_01415 [Halobacteriales archaeon SW_7_71_33]